MTVLRFTWLLAWFCMSACSSESHSDSKNTAAGATADTSAGGATASTELSAGGTTSTSDSTTGGVSHTGGTSEVVVHNGGRPATTWQPTACGGSSTLGSVDPTQLYYALAQSPRAFLLINVQFPVNRHIPTTDVDLAYTDVPTIEQFVGDDKSQPVILYCTTGAMASTAGAQIVADGYCNVSMLSGGLSAWRDTGYATEP